MYGCSHVPPASTPHGDATDSPVASGWKVQSQQLQPGRVYCTSNEPARVYAGTDAPTGPRCNWPKTAFLRDAVTQSLLENENWVEHAVGSWTKPEFVDKATAAMLGNRCMNLLHELALNMSLTKDFSNDQIGPHHRSLQPCTVLEPLTDAGWQDRSTSAL